MSEEREAFKASETSPVVAELPKKDAASPAKPLPPLELPISGERVTFTWLQPMFVEVLSVSSQTIASDLPESYAGSTTEPCE